MKNENEYSMNEKINLLIGDLQSSYYSAVEKSSNTTKVDFKIQRLLANDIANIDRFFNKDNTSNLISPLPLSFKDIFTEKIIDNNTPSILKSSYEANFSSFMPLLVSPQQSKCYHHTGYYIKNTDPIPTGMNSASAIRSQLQALIVSISKILRKYTLIRTVPIELKIFNSLEEAKVVLNEPTKDNYFIELDFKSNNLDVAYKNAITLFFNLLKGAPFHQHIDLILKNDLSTNGYNHTVMDLYHLIFIEYPFFHTLNFLDKIEFKNLPIKINLLNIETKDSPTKIKEFYFNIKTQDKYNKLLGSSVINLYSEPIPDTELDNYDFINALKAKVHQSIRTRGNSLSDLDRPIQPAHIDPVTPYKTILPFDNGSSLRYSTLALIPESTLENKERNNFLDLEIPEISLFNKVLLEKVVEIPKVFSSPPRYHYSDHYYYRENGLRTLAYAREFIFFLGRLEELFPILFAHNSEKQRLNKEITRSITSLLKLARDNIFSLEIVGTANQFKEIQDKLRTLLPLLESARKELDNKYLSIYVSCFDTNTGKYTDTFKFNFLLSKLIDFAKFLDNKNAKTFKNNIISGIDIYQPIKKDTNLWYLSLKKLVRGVDNISLDKIDLTYIYEELNFRQTLRSINKKGEEKTVFSSLISKHDTFNIDFYNLELIKKNFTNSVFFNMEANANLLNLSSFISPLLIGKKDIAYTSYNENSTIDYKWEYYTSIFNSTTLSSNTKTILFNELLLLKFLYKYLLVAHADITSNKKLLDETVGKEDKKIEIEKVLQSKKLPIEIDEKALAFNFKIASLLDKAPHIIEMNSIYQSDISGDIDDSYIEETEFYPLYRNLTSQQKILIKQAINQNIINKDILNNNPIPLYIMIVQGYTLKRLNKKKKDLFNSIDGFEEVPNWLLNKLLNHKIKD